MTRETARAVIGGGTEPGADPAVAHGSGAGRWLLPAVAIGTTLAPLNSTMIAVALPGIQDTFDVSVTATAWLVTLYLVAMAVGQPIGGRMGDLYGRRRVYLLGLVGFGIASVGCAFAPSLPGLVLFRLLQALSGALSFPNGAAMVREAVAPERRGAAFGAVGLATGLAAASGPPLGGLLVHAFGWAAIFWANVPVVAVAIGLCWNSLPRRTVAREPGLRFDLIGSGLLATSLGALIVIPTLLKLGQPGLACLTGVASVAAAVGFVRWELRTGAPVVDVRLFNRAPFAAACASIALSNLVLYTSLLALPLYLELVRGHSVQVVGLTLAALSALSAAWGPLGGRWTDRSGPWLPAVAGAVVLLAGSVVLAVAAGTTSLVPVAAALALMGIGIGVAGAPVQMAAVESVSHARTGSAAGIYSTARYMGSVVGSSALAIIFAQRPETGESGKFVALFAGLAAVALLGIGANARIAQRRAKPWSSVSSGLDGGHAGGRKGGAPGGSGEPRTAR